MKKKYILISLLIFAFLMAFIMLTSKDFFDVRKEVYSAGTYEGTGEGNIGPIRVSIVTDSFNIKEIKIIEEYEMPEISKYVYSEIPEKIIEKNSTDIDVISGATYTSEGLINAIEDALKKARIMKN